MTPEGPYTSPWVSLDHYVIVVKRFGERLFAVVPQGVQPEDARLFFSTKRDALAWLKENGFERKSK